MSQQVFHFQIGLKTLYKSNFLHTTLWAWVSAQRNAGISVNDSIRSYMHHFDVLDLEFNSLKHAYYRKSEEYMECAGEFSKDAKDCFDTKPDEVERVMKKLGDLVKSNNGK